LLLVALSVAYIALFVVFEYKEATGRSLLQLKSKVAIQSQYIDGWFNGHQSQIRYLARSKPMAEGDRKTIRTMFDTALKSFPELQNLLYVDKEGVVVTSTMQAAIGLNVSDRPYYQEAMKGNDSISDVTVTKTGGTAVVFVGSPIKDSDGRILGVVAGSLNIKTIGSVVRSTDPELTGNTFLADRRGEVISVRDGAVGGDDDAPRLSDEALHAALKRLPLPKHYMNESGEAVIGTYQWTNNSHWVVFGEISLLQAIANARLSIPVLGLFSLGILIVLIFLAIHVSKRFERPILNIVEGANRIQSGRFGQRIPVENGYMPMELQKLTDAFNTMAATVESKVFELERSRQKYKSLFEHNYDLVFSLDEFGKYRSVNPAVERVTGYSADELLNTSPLELLAARDRQRAEENFRKMLGGVASQEEYEITTKSGEHSCLQVSLIPIMIDGIMTGVFGIGKDITAQKRVNEELERISYVDGLTDVGNRRYFEQALRDRWKLAAAQRLPLSLILIDIDHFKKYNDRYGHIAGDECLRRVASIFMQTLQRPGDFVARYGGEEFVVLLPDTGERGALQVAERIRENIADSGILHAESPTARHLTISAGVVTVVPKEGMDPGQLLRKADEALYAAKRMRNKVLASAG
jgi:diguanylate cyclase (GGDEF)-like protein/PAS domain S-box-containing protein